MPQSFTRRASVWGEGRERGQTDARARTRRNLLRVPPALIPTFIIIFLRKNKDFGVGWRVCLSGVGVGGWGGGSRRLERKKVLNFPGRVAEIVSVKLGGGETG